MLCFFVSLNGFFSCSQEYEKRVPAGRVVQLLCQQFCGLESRVLALGLRVWGLANQLHSVTTTSTVDCTDRVGLECCT